MSKQNSGRRAGSSTRTVMTGGPARQLQKPIYGSTPKQSISPNMGSLNTTRKTHIIGAPRSEK